MWLEHTSLQPQRPLAFAFTALLCLFETQELTSPLESASPAVCLCMHNGQIRNTGMSVTRLHLSHKWNSFTDPIERPSLVARRCRVSHFILPNYETELWQFKKMALLISHWHAHVCTQMREKKRQLSGFSLETGLRGSIEKWSIAQAACFSVKTLPTNSGDSRDASLFPGSGRAPGGGTWQPTPVFLPGESHGQRSLVGYSPWDRRVGYDWACTHTEKRLGACMACCCVCEGLTQREKTGGLPLWLPTPTVTVSLLSPAKQHCTQIPNSAHVWSSSSSFCSLGICWAGSPHSLTMTRRTQTPSLGIIVQMEMKFPHPALVPTHTPQETVGAELPSPATVLSPTAVKNAFWSVTCF